jgi:hypothetical protein
MGKLLPNGQIASQTYRNVVVLHRKLLHLSPDVTFTHSLRHLSASKNNNPEKIPRKSSIGTPNAHVQVVLRSL